MLKQRVPYRLPVINSVFFGFFVFFFKVDFSFFLRYRPVTIPLPFLTFPVPSLDRDRDRYFEFFEYIIFNYFFKPNINCEDV
jgi:hypothetical protein